ncbi:MAG: hypothetical protein IPP44_30615 [Ideonella sp.]|nr:hypothetical protein [Ideonella sp.]
MGDIAVGWFFTAKGENDKFARQVRNSAGIAVLDGEVADKAHWVVVVRAYGAFLSRSHLAQRYPQRLQ